MSTRSSNAVGTDETAQPQTQAMRKQNAGQMVVTAESDDEVI